MYVTNPQFSWPTVHKRDSLKTTLGHFRCGFTYDLHILEQALSSGISENACVTNSPFSWPYVHKTDRLNTT